MSTYSNVNMNTHKWNYFVFKLSYGSYGRKVAVLAPNKEIAKLSIGFTEDERIENCKETSSTWMLGKKTKLNPKELINLFQTLQKCMKSGASISKALQIAVSGAREPLTRGIIGVLLFFTSKNGLSLSEAFEKLKPIFDPITTAMVKAGERSGELSTVLEDLAHRMEQASIIKSKTLAGLYYPLFVVGITIIGALVVNFFVFPSIIHNFKMMNAKLPMLTQLMVDLIQMTSSHPWIFLIPVFGIIALWAYRKKIAQAHFFQRSLIKIPVIGQLIAGSIFERSLHTLSLLQKTGINVVDAYKMTIEVSGNVAFKEYFSAVLEHIKVGNTPDKAFLKERFRLGKHSVEIANLMRVASFTGEDWKAFAELANALAEDVKIKSEALPKLIQPVLLLFIALIVGLMIAAIYLPSFYLLLSAFKH